MCRLKLELCREEMVSIDGAFVALRPRVV